eukprot:CAMPEP_0184382470 /NCGR_PEP_ID=MMETSP0007-20130409/6361_1 /TAXON_ID=97485 /ORGANISM="Prymnesium parvum, Strain Texoma1" /LENGTH=122 /DNA_ID=CAMNT_0026728531 /DNA_START=14 /DNA_END=378 /DNA_ORIENTATION=+
MKSSIEHCRGDRDVANGGEERSEAVGGPNRRADGVLSWLEVRRCFESLPDRKSRRERLRKARASGRAAASETCLAQELCAFGFPEDVRHASCRCRGQFSKHAGGRVGAGWDEHVQAADSFLT